MDPEMLLYETIESLDVEMLIQEITDQSFDINPHSLLQSKSIDTTYDTVPTTIAIPTTIQNEPNTQLLQCLFDTGGSHTIINKRALPKDAKPTSVSTIIQARMAAGLFQMKDYVSIDNMILPEFSKSFKINSIMAYIYDVPDSRYDIIFGRDVLEHMNVDVCYSTHTVTWLHHTIKMKNEDFFNQH